MMRSPSANTALYQMLHLDIRFTGSVDALAALNDGRCVVAGFHSLVGADADSQTARTYRPLLDPATRAYFSSDRLWLTTPLVVGGILRFMQLVTGRAGRGVKAESPTQEMLRDEPFMLLVVLWVLVFFVIIYNLRPA